MIKYYSNRHRKGFTLIEILLVIALIAILASITIVAINPAGQFEKARDTERASDLNAIMSAIHQYATDNDGAFPGNLSTSEFEICATDTVDCTGMYDLSDLTDNETYLVEMPIDPFCPDIDDSQCEEGGTGYRLSLTSGGRIYLLAQGENGAIELTQ